MSSQIQTASPPSWPRFTIVTPVLNGARDLRETMLSIIEQDYPNLQYIIVDGGSTDDSLNIVSQYAAHVSRLIQGKDRSLYDAVAKGFDASTGEILAYLNSDDLYHPGILRRIGRLFADHPDWQIIYADDTVWKQGWLVANRPQKQLGLPELLRGHIIPQASAFFRKSAYLAVGGFDRQHLKVAGDHQFWMRLAARYPMHFLPEQASTFRLRPNQLTNDWGRYLAEMHSAIAGARTGLKWNFLLFMPSLCCP